jgi:hypothetical protein
MITLERISEKIRAWLRNRETGLEWSLFSYPDLRPIRISRSDNEDVVLRQRRGWAE